MARDRTEADREYRARLKADALEIGACRDDDGESRADRRATVKLLRALQRHHAIADVRNVE